MHYNFRTYLCSTALAVIIGIGASGSAYAQGVVSLAEDIEVEENTLPDNSNAGLALFDETAPTPGMSSEDNADALPSDEAPAFLGEAQDPNAVPVNEPSVGPGAQGVQNAPNIPLSGSANGAAGNQPLLGANPAAAAAPAPAPAPLLKPSTDDLADKLIAKTNDTLFSQMSDLERQTTLLTLELRREKIKSEIEAIKAQRRRAEAEEKAYFEELERKKKEWENEQARLLLVEEQKIIELEIAMEKERQERVVKAYKDYMLEENQKWIKNNEEIYKNLAQVEKERDDVYLDLKKKINSLFTAAAAQVEAVKAAKGRYDKKIEDFNLQIAILKARLEAAEAEKRALKKNPFAEGDNFMEHPDANHARLSNEYAVLEVRGQGDQLVAKLMNSDKKTFNVKVGTTLHTGHVIDEITRNYVRGELDGFKDFIYLSVGNAIEREPVTTVEDRIRADSASEKNSAASAAPASTRPTRASARSARKRTLNTNMGIPSVSSGLMVK